jgi:hypothetical protein
LTHPQKPFEILQNQRRKASVSMLSAGQTGVWQIYLKDNAAGKL